LNEQRLYPSAGIHGQVAHTIGGRIVSGDIPVGALLPREAELAEQFSVSRQAIREALKVLAAKGLVQSRRRTGTRVLPRTSWNLFDPDVLAWHPLASIASRLLLDLGELRMLIEPGAAEFAATRGSETAIAAIESALKTMRRSVDQPEDFRQADAGFHVAVFAAAGNEFIAHLAEILGPLLQASFRIQDEARGALIARAVVPLHDAVFEAIVARDGPRARQKMRELLELAERNATELSRS
jgi:DNA-binding FadR family transcriptional regulator